MSHAGNKVNLTHKGNIIDTEYGYKAKCACKKKFSDRLYTYEANDDLFDHYRQEGTVTCDEESNMTSQNFLKDLSTNKTGKRYMLRKKI